MTEFPESWIFFNL